jgi:hypothetical protein
MNSPALNQRLINTSLLCNNKGPNIQDDGNSTPNKLTGPVVASHRRGSGSGAITTTTTTMTTTQMVMNTMHPSKKYVDTDDHFKTCSVDVGPANDDCNHGINISDTSSSNSTTSTAHNIKKTVRLATDKRGRILCEHYRNREPKNKKEMMACFYTMNEFKEFRRECKQEAILQQKTLYRDNFAAVYAACTTGIFKNVTRERAYISAATCRGLEVVVFPTLHNDRKNMIATVLRTQASLPDHMNYTERMETIASASRFLSKQTRQLARVLGSGDAAVVVANQRIESLQRQQQQQQQQHDSKTGTVISAMNTVVVPHCYVSC